MSKLVANNSIKPSSQAGENGLANNTEDGSEKDWLEWLAWVMPRRPQNNMYLDSERGMEIGKLCLELARDDFAWRRSDKETFWVDVQLFTKYKLDDNEVRFISKMQPGVDNFKIHANEKNAYAEMVRGMDKLRTINAERLEVSNE